MSSHLVLLELIGQALLPMIAESEAVFDRSRLVRDVWGNWAKICDPATRQAHLHALATLPINELREQIHEIVRRLLPDQAGPESAAMTRYLTALPLLLHRLEPRGIEQADDLLRRLPPRIPNYLPGDRVPALADYELVELMRISPHAEVWTARNHEIPERPYPLIVLFDQAEEARRVLAWHRNQMDTPGLLPVEDSFLNAPTPGLRFASAGAPSFEMRSHLFRAVVQTVATLHSRQPPAAVGAILQTDVFLREGQAALLVLDPPSDSSPREDMPYLGRLGLQLLTSPESELLDLLTSCQAANPQERPAQANELLARLPLETVPTPRLEPVAPRPRTRRTGEVWKLLDTLQHTQPERPKLLTNAIGMRFVLIPEGKFLMGSPKDELGRRDNEGPQHDVVLTRAFYLAVTPTTQEQYERVMGINPSRFQGAAGGGPDHPVECISWHDAVAFCAKLSELPTEVERGHVYRLPTEAEWEYACRAGSHTPFHTGPSLSPRDARIDGGNPYGSGPSLLSPPHTGRVASYPANLFGLHDMHGNVWEWCSDWYDASYYQHSPRHDPPGPESGVYRVLRGGSWRNQASTCRSAYRNALPPNQHQPYIGCRVVLIVSSE